MADPRLALYWVYLGALVVAFAGFFLPFATEDCRDCLGLLQLQGSLLQGQDAQVLFTLVSVAMLLGVLQLLLSLTSAAALPWVIAVARSWRFLLLAQLLLPLAALGAVGLDAASPLSRVLKMPPAMVTFTQDLDIGFYFSVVGLAVSPFIAFLLLLGNPRSSWSWPQLRAIVES